MPDFVTPIDQRTSVKASNQTVDGTSYADITDLGFVVAPFERWAFMVIIHYASPTDEDAKFQFTVPANATFLFAGSAFSASLGFANGGNVGATTTYTVGGADSTAVSAWFSGTITAGATRGYLQLQGAQNAQVDGDLLTVYAGSYVVAWRS